MWWLNYSFSGGTKVLMGWSKGQLLTIVFINVFVNEILI
jgi:hypothetical protein